MRYQRAEPPLRIDGLEAARSFFTGCFADSDPTRESLWIAHVDDDANCLHVSHHQGDATGAAFPIRGIIVDAAMHGSAGLVLAHNHPSGDATPSDADIRETRRLVCAAEAIGCRIIDHLVYAGKDMISFRALGLL